MIDDRLKSSQNEGPVDSAFVIRDLDFSCFDRSFVKLRQLRFGFGIGKSTVAIASGHRLWTCSFARAWNYTSRFEAQNVLVIKERSISAKISDMGISKHLDGDMSSLSKHATGYGSSGWQTPEQLRNERQTCAVDLFSLGCMLFFCLTGGKHPFGESIERDVNIVNAHKDLFLIDHIPEVKDLVSQLLDPNPRTRPKATEVMNHPLFWSSEMRLSFLHDVSDRIELEDRENASELLEALENTGKSSLDGKWDEKMETALINDIGRFRRYRYDNVRDLLRVIRNKLNHYRELSREIK